MLNSQDIGDHADTPQVCFRRHRLFARHFRRSVFWAAVLHVQLALRVVASREAEVDNLQFVGSRAEQEQVFRLKNKHPRCVKCLNVSGVIKIYRSA